MVVFLIDADNLNGPGWIEEACQKLEATEGNLAVRRAYGSAENLKGLAEILGAWAIRPFVNLSLSKNTTDLALAVDAMELACQMPRPTVVAIGSGDADFAPLVVRLRERGIRTICISGRNKMAPEVVRAYDDVILLGAEYQARQPVSSEVDSPLAPARKAAARKIASTKSATKAAPAKKVAAKKTANEKAGATQGTTTLQQILHAAPALKTGQMQGLGDIAKLLHDAKLLGKNATSTKLFKKYADQFELSPLKQPNKVRYIGS